MINVEALQIIRLIIKCVNVDIKNMQVQWHKTFNNSLNRCTADFIPFVLSSIHNINAFCPTLDLWLYIPHVCPNKCIKIL